MNTDLNVSQGTIAGREDTLVKSLRTAAGDAGDAAKDAAKDVVNTTAEGLGAARAKAESKLSEMASRFEEARAAVTRKACSAADTTHEYVRENPWKVLGGAAVAGFVIGILLSRR